MQILDLKGSWRYETDEEKTGEVRQIYRRRLENDGFFLPGSSCENKIGKPQENYDYMDKDTVRAPRERYEYVGPLWLEREVLIPEDFAQKEVRLFLERVNMASSFWLDGKQIGRQTVALSTPHTYRLTGCVTPGIHRITLRIDNSNLLNTDKMASGYSVDTQGYWNGIIGRIELQCEHVCHIDHVQIYPNQKEIAFKAVTTSDIKSPLSRKKAYLTAVIKDMDNKVSEEYSWPFTYHTSKQVAYYSFPLTENLRIWSEYDAYLYRFCVRLFVEDGAGFVCTDEKEYPFGMRTISVKDKQFCLNDQTISLRGTTNCAIYPLTGYPPTDLDSWRAQFRILKSYGLNYMRFHAWCPPDNAFTAADEAGVYVSVEMPLWLNLDVCALETGDDALHAYYYEHEALAISREYGNHPSFLLFSNGNELLGDFEMLDAITTRIKAYDNRRFYTLTSNFDHPILPSEDYLCAFEAGGHPVRIQNMQEEAGKSTALTYQKAVDEVSVPIISFEIGQYCVYPNVDEADDYTGNLMPVNLSVIKKHMEQKGVYPYLADYVKASGDLAVKLYKEDIEAALRTKGFGGFGLLSLCDYTGQCTATVGILDVFYRSKGLITPEEFRSFCSECVPLFLAKRIYANDESLSAELDVYDYRQKREENPQFELKIYLGSEVFYETWTRERHIDIPLERFETAAMLKVTLTVCGFKNSWRIFVYPRLSHEDEKKPLVVSGREEIKTLLKEGGRAIVAADALKYPIKGSFIPVFWSPAFFETDAACGALIRHEHPVFRNFPTEQYPDYQWKTILEHSVCADLQPFGSAFRPIMEPVPNFFDNGRRSPLFEAKIGKAEILFCGFDLHCSDITTAQLRRSIYDYVCSEEFAPQEALDENLFLQLF